MRYRAAAAVTSEPTFEKIVLRPFEMVGKVAAAATATKPAIRAYSMRSWPRLSLQEFKMSAKVLFTRVSLQLRLRLYFTNVRMTAVGRHGFLIVLMAVDTQDR